MTYRNQDMQLWAGDDNIIRFAIDNIDELYGTTAKYIMTDAKSGDNVIDEDITNDIGTNVDVPLYGTRTRDLIPGRYYHKLTLIDAEGTRITLATGNVVIYPEHA